MAGLRRLEEVSSEITETNDTDLLYIARGGDASKISIGDLKSNINVGVLPDERLPPRLRESSQIITDWNAALNSGWYRGQDAAHAPGSGWYMGEVVKHYDTWVTQTVHDFDSDSGSNTKSYRRDRNYSGGNGVWTPWYRVRITEAEQSAIYRNASNLNAGVVPLARLPYAQSAGGVGSLMFASNNSGGAVGYWQLAAGSSLRPSTAGAPSQTSYVPTGTWRCLGYKTGTNTSWDGDYETTLWMRIA